MAQLHNVILCAAIMVAVWTVIGLPFAARLAAAPISWLWAPALGFALHSVIALPLLGLLGMSRLGVLALTIVLAGAALVLCLWQRRLLAARPDAWLVVAVIAAALLAAAPAAGVLPKATAEGVTLSASIFDHVKIAMVDEMIRAGVPLRNPYFSDVATTDRVAYYYLCHYSAALIALLAGTSGWEADAALAGFTAFSSLLLMIGLVARLDGRPSSFVVVVALAASASLRPLLEGVAPETTKAVIGQASGLGSWLFQGAWAPQHLASATCVVLSCILLHLVACQKGWLAPLTLGLVAAAGFQCSAWVGGVTFTAAAVAITLALLWSLAPRQRTPFLLRLAFAAVPAIALCLPFLRDQLASAAPRGVSSPVLVAPVSVLGPIVPQPWRELLDLPAYWLVYLPVEFTAFYPAGVIGLFVLLKDRNSTADGRTLARAVALLAAISLVAGWLLCSVVGPNNDLGWRAVLPAMLCLIVFAAVALSRWPSRPARLCAVLMAGGIALTLPETLELLRENFFASRTPADRQFAETPALWQAARQHTRRDERIANNPRFLEDMTPWPVNISWALLANRRSCYAGNELAIPFAPISAAERAAIEAQFARIFDGAPAADDLKKMAERYRCDVVVVTPQDGAWTRDPFAASGLYRRVEERPDAWRIYRRAQ